MLLVYFTQIICKILVLTWRLGEVTWHILVLSSQAVEYIDKSVVRNIHPSKYLSSIILR